MSPIDRRQCDQSSYGLLDRPRTLARDARWIFIGYAALGTQQLEQPPRRQPLARRSLAVRLQHRVEPHDKCPKPRLRLNLPLVAKLGRRAPHRLAHRLSRNPQLAHDLADRLLIYPKRPPDP